MPNKRDPLRDDLRRWAAWASNWLTGYDSTTVLSRAMEGQLEASQGIVSVLNVEPKDPWLAKINREMANLAENPQHRRYITMMQLYYVIGPAGITEKLGRRPDRTIRDWKKRGEDLLRARLQANE